MKSTKYNIICFWSLGVVAGFAAAQLRAEDSGEVLLRQLQSPNAQARRSAAETLGNDGGIVSLVKDLKGAIPSLLPALKDPDPEVRSRIALALWAIGLSENGTGFLNEAVPAMIEALKDNDPRVRECVAFAIWAVMPQPPVEAGKPLLKLLNDKQKGVERTVQQAALAALGRIKPATPEMVAGVLKLLKEDKDVRGEAMNTLGEFGSSDPEVISALVDFLKDPERFVRQEAVGALGNIGPPACYAATELAKVVENSQENRGVRENAIGSLYRVAPKEPMTISTLVNILKDPSLELRRTAIAYLGRMGPPAHAAIPELKKTANDPKENQATRDRAAAALRKIEQGD